MKRKPDWADKKAASICEGPSDDAEVAILAAVFRSIERRGFMRAVKALRSEARTFWNTNSTSHDALYWSEAADFLERNK
jgi:hypothetical protein